jgi:hypothetical protein
MPRILRAIPFFRLLAIGKTALLARRHLQRLDPNERRRMAELVRRGRGMSTKERDELRLLVGKLGPREFAFLAANSFSPVPLPRRLAGRPAR